MSQGDLLTFPAIQGGAPGQTQVSGRYEVRFARTPADLDRILRLRYEVFNLELKEGLAASLISGRDEDEFDRKFHHLLIAERETGEVVGTYRMQTAEMAARHGYYSSGLFEVEALPGEVLAAAVEIGRACVARAHRNGRVLQLLWRGLASYLSWNDKRMLFGCCSLTSQDQALGASVHSWLERKGHVHQALRVEPREPHRCGSAQSGVAGYPPPHVPALFLAYLKIGARVLGPPAIDREFRTIDWLVMLDICELPAPVYRTMFQ
ncbi:MAG TPA: GNAT family N-acyltransferase [Gemmatimonadales bacterium]|nr:GNAT family N-acyltransferase [Gemmatimonadales bacterium]